MERQIKQQGQRRKERNTEEVAKAQEGCYRGPPPMTLYIMHEDPREFSRLQLALEKILSDDAIKFKFQILLDQKVILLPPIVIARDWASVKLPFDLKAHNGFPFQDSLALQNG
ncbi:uncharacterized protein LOC122148653 [Tachysurus ichikawai]